jgi:hypothetical protein
MIAGGVMAKAEKHFRGSVRPISGFVCPSSGVQWITGFLGPTFAQIPFVDKSIPRPNPSQIQELVDLLML